MANIRPFRFSLAPVLRQREREEREAQKAMSELVRMQMLIEGRLRELNERMETGKRDLGGSLVGLIDTELIRSQAQMSMQLDLQARQLVLELAEVYRRVAVARDALLQAVKRRKAIERLRDRRKEAWRIEMNRAESKETDDLTMTRVANRSVEETTI